MSSSTSSLSLLSRLVGLSRRASSSFASSSSFGTASIFGRWSSLQQPRVGGTGTGTGTGTGAPVAQVRAYGKPPSEAGGPAKGYSSFKRRFKTTGSGAIRAMSPGFVHKRFNKSNRRLNRLSKGILVPPTYEKMMQKLGFTARKF